MNPPYANLAQAREYLALASQNTDDDAVLLSFLNRASRSIDRYCRRPFFPKRETRTYDYKMSDRIKLDAELLKLDTLTTENGGETIGQSILIFQTGENYNYGPWDTITIRSDSGSLLNFSATEQQANSVTGFWGYHEDYANAWVDTGTSLAGSYAASATSLSLAGAGSAGVGASDVNFEAPRISPGDLLWVEGEMFLAVGGAGNNNATVIPHFSGTSSNDHASGVAVYKFTPEPDINFATLRLTSWMYGQRMSPYESKTAFVQLGTVSIPSSWATDIRDKIDRYKRTTLVIYPD